MLIGAATTTEGIFRLSGSEKRIKELKNQFDSPDRYGKGLSWEGYTVHDAANVFRRYLNDLPEPVVPLDLYEKFREPLRGATKQAVGDAEGPQFVENFDEKAAIIRYQTLITELPPLNKQLLLYILDLLAVFAAKSDENRMTSQNLAAIFQPGMLSHPNHAMAPEEYRLNQCVIIFLIENQDHFLIGMQGTGTDEETRQIVESGAAAPVTPTVKTGGVARSSSNASAGANSVRREGQIRRNRSVTSRHSRQNDSPGPNSPALSASHTGSLGRSNTVPSKRSPAVGGGKFKKVDNSSGPHSPAYLEPLTPVHQTETPRLSEHSSLAPAVGAVNATTGAGRSQERLLEVPNDSSTPRKERQLQSLFNRSPTDDGKRQPNKLQKKRLPGSLNQSAQSSNTSLPQSGNVISPTTEPTNPLDQPGPISDAEKQQALDGAQESTPRASQVPQQQHGSALQPDSQLKRQKSPPTSLHSSYHDASDQDQAVENPNGLSSSEKEKKSKWRISRSARKEEDPAIRSNENLGASQTSFTSGSAGGKPRKSFTEMESDRALVASDTQHSSSTDKEESKGLFSRIRDKVREAKERNKSPPPNDPAHASLAVRGKSMDIKRDQPTEKPTEPVPTTAAAPMSDKPTEAAAETPQKATTEEPKAPVTEGTKLATTAAPSMTTEPIPEEPPTIQPDPVADLKGIPEEQPTVVPDAEPAAAPATAEPQEPAVPSDSQPEVKPEVQPEASKQA